VKPRSILICAILGVCLGAAHAQLTPTPAPTYDALIQQGKTQLQSGNSAQALTSGQQAIQLDATRWEAYALAGK
jgi:Flp pilus assembly protein TadD